MIWAADQQRILTALGYTVYRSAQAATASLPAPSQQAETMASAASTPSFDRLRSALQRAAGRDLGGLTLPPMEQLRIDPGAKRALWPRLRALRRSH